MSDSLHQGGKGRLPFYVASRASLPERPAMWRRLRDEGGVRITSSWIDEAGEGETACNTELWDRIEAEVRQAGALILYAEASDFPLKGALVEVGMALGMGKPVMIVAPGVELEPRSLRPLGSWSAHSAVTFHPSVQHALADADALWATPTHDLSLSRQGGTGGEG